MTRRTTRSVMCGNVGIGSEFPVTVQSMTNTDTRDVKQTLEQINKLVEAGCDIVRVAVPDEIAAYALHEIVKGSSIPVVADIHFNHTLAIKAIEAGVSKIRINPGNIGDENKVREVVKAAKEKNIPIRIGVNGGSLERDIVKKYGGVTSEGIVESAMKHIKILEDLDFYDIIVALKSSDVNLTIDSYTKLADKCDYPLHVGLTEAGTVKRGTIKSSIAIGALLSKGLGDTIRVSLTGDPVEEVFVAREILKSLDLIKTGVKFISCPTCGRCMIDLEAVAKEVEEKCEDLDKNITIAIMGCAVNGPGEAREADIGLAGGNGEALIFKKGEIFKKVPEKDAVKVIIEEIMKM